MGFTFDDDYCGTCGFDKFWGVICLIYMFVHWAAIPTVYLLHRFGSDRWIILPKLPDVKLLSPEQQQHSSDGGRAPTKPKEKGKDKKMNDIESGGDAPKQTWRHFAVTVHGKYGKVMQTALEIDDGAVCYLKYTIGFNLIKGVSQGGVGGVEMSLSYEGRPKPKVLTFVEGAAACEEACALIEKRLATPPAQRAARKSVLPPTDAQGTDYDEGTEEVREAECEVWDEQDAQQRSPAYLSDTTLICADTFAKTAAESDRTRKTKDGNPQWLDPYLVKRDDHKVEIAPGQYQSAEGKKDRLAAYGGAQTANVQPVDMLRTRPTLKEALAEHTAGTPADEMRRGRQASPHRMALGLSALLLLFLVIPALFNGFSSPNVNTIALVVLAALTAVPYTLNVKWSQTRKHLLRVSAGPDKALPYMTAVKSRRPVIRMRIECYHCIHTGSNLRLAHDPTRPAPRNHMFVMCRTPVCVYDRREDYGPHPVQGRPDRADLDGRVDSHPEDRHAHQQRALPLRPLPRRLRLAVHGVAAPALRAPLVPAGDYVCGCGDAGGLRNGQAEVPRGQHRRPLPDLHANGRARGRTG